MFPRFFAFFVSSEEWLHLTAGRVDHNHLLDLVVKHTPSRFPILRHSIFGFFF